MPIFIAPSMFKIRDLRGIIDRPMFTFWKVIDLILQEVDWK